MTSPGDAAYLGSLVGGMDFWGVMGDGQCPPMINGSFDLSGSDGGIDLSIIEGDQGPPGQPADICQMQYENNFTSPADLPENLLDIALDIGKTWWIGNVVYVWTGTDFYQKQMGVPGPPGPCPVVVAQAEIVPSGIPGVSLTQPIEVQQFTTNEGLNVSLVFEFDQDSITGPPGPTGPIVNAPDYDNSIPPSDGEAIVWVAAEQMFAPSSFDFLAVPTYSIPESAFVSYQGRAASQIICQFELPPQPFAWIPLVFGNVATSQDEILGLFGVGTAPVTASVMLGDPNTGTLIGAGFGNTSNYNFISPHFSTPTSPSTAISPTGSTAVVPAYHTGNQGLVSVALINNGGTGTLFGLLEEIGLVNYEFSSQNAQLVVLCVPVSNAVTPATPLTSALITLTQSLGGTSPSSLSSLLASFVGDITSVIQGALDGLSNALGHLGSGHTVAEVEAYLAGIASLSSGGMVTSLENLLSSIGGVSISHGITYLQGISGVISSGVQTAIDAVANLVSLGGTGNTPASVVTALTGATMTTDLQNALNTLTATLGVPDVAAELTAFTGAVTSPIQTDLDAVASDLGVTGTGNSIDNVVTWLTQAVDTITVPPALTILTTSIGGTTIPAVVSNLESFEGTVTSDVQSALNKVASSLGISSIVGTVASVSSALSKLIGL